MVKINNEDTNILKKYLSNSIKLEKCNIEVSDVNSDSVVDINDYNLLKEYISLKIENESGYNYLTENKNSDEYIEATKEDILNIYNEYNITYCIKNNLNDECNYSSNNTFNNLSVGTYFISAKSKAGALVTYKIIISEDKDNINPTIKSVTSRCNKNKSSASMQIKAKDNKKLSIKPYSIYGTNFRSSKKLDVKKNGTYTIYVRDAVGNTATKNVEVTCIDEVKPTIKNVTKTKNSDNTVTITINGAKDNIKLASNPYSLHCINYQSKNSFIVKKNESYNICVKDEAGNKIFIKVLIEGLKK